VNDDVPGKIADIRKDYILASLDEGVAGNDPIVFFHQWFREAQAAAIDEVNAMTLATVDAEGRPHARIVLLKALDEQGFTFFTNYESAKGHQLGASPHAAIVFFWKELERQVRIEGIVEQVSSEESDAYFNSRPAGSRIGAWASPQSSVIAHRQILEERAAHFAHQYTGDNIPRPSFWGGYRVLPLSMEFWQGRSSRLHDRILFTREELGVNWEVCRLAP
jgi:pyridoxamine 5'-phosphate oxidase